MSVGLEGNVVWLRGDCRADDAESVLTLLQADPNRSVDLAETSLLHTAVLQVLLALRPELTGPVGDPFIRRWLAPLLTQETND
jgi:hypothetical protein